MPVLERIITWNSARRAERWLRSIRNKYIGCEVIEVMPSGNLVRAEIVDMTWESSYGLDGGWAVRVKYLEGDMAGQESETSDTVLELTGAKVA